MRVAELEKNSKESTEKYVLFSNECYRAAEKNQKLYKLINCIASMSALQTSSTFKELPSTENVDNPLLKKDSVKTVQKALMDTLKSLNLNNLSSSAASQPKSIMPAPPHLMIQDAPAEEELKVPKLEDNEDSYGQYNYMSNSPHIKPSGGPSVQDYSLYESVYENKEAEQQLSSYYGSVGLLKPTKDGSRSD
jgi:hypothetical protein